MEAVPQRVVITGIGAITAIGSGTDALWQGILRGESGIRPITQFDPSPFDSQVAGEVTDFDPLAYFPARRVKRLDRFAQFSLVAAKMAVDDANRQGRALLSGASPHPQVGVCTGTALGGVALAEYQHELFMRQGIRAVNPALAFLVFGGSGGSHVAIEFGLTGPGNTNSNSCGSGAIALGEAFRLIRGGEALAMVAGAAEAPLAPLTFGAFDVLHALGKHNADPARACRPFDATRDGFVMGEGAAMFILEERRQALLRGAHIYAEILGYASNNDAWHMLAPRPDASCAARCIQHALTDARVSPAHIEYINAHATGTPLGDAAETLAIKHVFGERARRIPVSSTKPFHAHALGASGAIEIAICALALDHDYLPPTLNLNQPDPECDLDYIPHHGRSARVNRILSNSFGFGGTNASLVLGRHE
ncbi:MAG TPA: beta-ketoacyl-[acyl-carrier-protein] synthase family protein [Verrucomicrobiae bacterium]|nr:beta-ketoacyl-[acyl-carrier-protein] synthase family protein [Verrucomicrobiae bacterium]